MSVPAPSALASAHPALAAQIKGFARTLGFAELRIADLDLSAAEPKLLAWLQQGMHGQMDYMARHGDPPGSLRARPHELVPGAVRALCVRLDYLPATDSLARQRQRVDDPEAAQVSLYAHGRDYHKVVRNRLQQLADQVAALIGPFGYRVFCDSAPVLEVELATRAGLGWRGKHTLLLNRDGGSLSFLGEILIDLPLPVDAPATDDHCGRCRQCLDACPTRAIVAPYVVDARRCISYLTIELDGPIPPALRPAIGNRIYGCDDCQLVCPWNKFAQLSPIPDFAPRAGLDRATLIELAGWSEDDFLARTAGSAIRRIGFVRWQRNLAVALGNALTAAGTDTARARPLQAALAPLLQSPSELVCEHALWALERAAQQIQ